MNPLNSFSSLKFALRQICGLILVVMLAHSAAAQTAILSWTTTTLSNSADQTVSGITYLDKYITIDTFTTAAGTYNAQSASTIQADHAYIRRNTTAQPNDAGWMSIRQGSNTVVQGTYYSTEEQLLLSGNLLNSTFDTFTNNTGTLSGQSSNVERIDYPTGTSSSATSTTSTWNAVTLANGDSLSGTGSFVFTQSPQGLGGAAINLTDLGVAVGQTIYGYSIMAPDVTPTVASDLVNWQNSSVYRTTTNQVDGTADFAAFGGRFIRPIPEPSTYGAIFLGVGLAAYGLRRRFGRSAGCHATPATPAPAGTGR